MEKKESGFKLLKMNVKKFGIWIETTFEKSKKDILGYCKCSETCVMVNLKRGNVIMTEDWVYKVPKRGGKKK